MRKESSNFLSFLFSLLILLFIKDIQARKLQQKVCSPSCGDIKNISYPFRLKGDPKGCGEKGYELSCQSNQAILEFHSGKYYVKNISYDQQIITVVDVNLANENRGLVSNESCGFRSNLSIWPLIDSESPYIGLFGDYFNLVRCSRNISENTYRKLLCFNKNQSYLFVTYGDYYISDLPKSCSFIATVPTRDASLALLSYETINKLLQSGFDLRWCVECDGSDAILQTSLFIIRITFVTFLTIHLGGIILSIITSITYGLFSLSQRFVLANLISGSIIDVFKIIMSIIYWLFSLSQRFLLRYLPLDDINFYVSNFIEVVFNLPFGNISTIVVCEFVVTRFVFVMVFIVLIICKYKRTTKTVDNVEKFLYNQQSWMPKRYSYMEIIAITNHFRDKLGQGGFGTVYKAQLLNGSLVAVKMLGNSKFSGEEFINEVSTIGRIHHSNVVRLVGFCSEGSKRALIYEYMPNGSLDRHIFMKKCSNQSFSWEKLQEIALGTARGIDYLHNGCDVCILHFDIKPHNILLDHDFNPKVADFGLAKLYPKENNFICVSATRGTIGYIAPELISRNFGTISCKSDVYSFGMLLLEMVGGRRNSFAKATRSSKAYFPSWAYDQIIDGRDLELQNVSSFEEVIGRKLCIIGLWCIQVKAADRPSINKVIEMLEGSIDDLQMPPKPFFSPSTQCNSIREIQSDSSTELLEYSESIEECSFTDHGNDV